MATATAKVVDVVVVGRGMIGSAAASHLARAALHNGASASVCCIGPSEDLATKTVFGCHYDEGRITRRTDRSPVWAALASRSIDRYREVEEATGVEFFHETGHLSIGVAAGDYIKAVAANASASSVKHSVLSGEQLRSTFKCLGPAVDPSMYCAVLETEGAGWISARHHVTAHCALAAQHGCEIVNDEVTSVRQRDTGGDGGRGGSSSGVAGAAAAAATPGGPTSFEVTTSGGQRYHADKVLVAPGAFTNFKPLLPQPLKLQLLSAQVIRIRLDTDAIAELSGLPTIIFKGPEYWCYILPPISYPDGETYLKLGGATNIPNPTVAEHNGAEVPVMPGKMILRSLDELTEWYKGTGDPATTAAQLKMAVAVLPSLERVLQDPSTVVVDTCATTHTPTKQLYLGEVLPGLSVATGGNGYAAKSSDEIGRLASTVVLAGAAASSATSASSASSPTNRDTGDAALLAGFVPQVAEE